MNSNFFTNNLSIKIISLIVAIILWLYAVSELNPEVTKNITDVKVEIINMDVLNDKQLTLVEDPVDNITIRIRGLVNDIRKVNTANLKAVLDLSEIDWTGTRQVELKIEGLVPREVKLDKIPEIPITINKIATKVVPVVVEVTGNGGEGYFVHEATAEPQNITIYGAESLVDIVVKGVVQVKLDKDESTIKQSLPIKLVDAAGRVVESEYLNLRQEFAMVSIPIYPIKSVAVKANIIGQPANGFVVDGISIDPPRLTINGYASILGNLSSLSTEAIDIQNAVENVYASVGIMLEEGVFLEPGQPSKVNVVVNIRETTIEKNIQISNNHIAVKNVPEGFQATMENISISLQLKGPYTAVNAITAQSLAPAVDLAQLDPAPGEENFVPGQYELPLTLTIPNRAELIQISSEFVIVDIQAIEQTEPGREE
ncbi:MAG TPA: hypothetical protein GX505_00255 [Clostridiales bacterium]|nr:hypothetical protein [Clostridiales bacterium]